MVRITEFKKAAGVETSLDAAGRGPALREEWPARGLAADRGSAFLD